MSNTKISDDAFKTLAQMPSLTGLSLQYNHFTNVGLEHLRDDVKLEQLIIGLGELEIDDQGLAHLQKLVNLQRLDIANSRVEGPGLRFLDEMRQLKDLWAGGTRIQPAYFDEFQKVHPNCKIEK